MDGKAFFKFFSPEISSEKMKIPRAFTKNMHGKLPKRVYIEDRYGNMWPLGVAKIGRDLYFQDGWVRFIGENSVELGDFFVFDYDGNGVFHFKLLGKTACEKKGVGGLRIDVKDEEEIEEHSKGKKAKDMNSENESSNFSDSDEGVEYMVEQEKEEEEDDDDDSDDDVEFIEEQETEEVDDDSDEEYEEEVEEINEKAFNPYSDGERLKKSGFKRATTDKVKDLPELYGGDIFKSGRATQPKNPYFVTKIRPKRRDQLYVPVDVVRDYRLTLPPKLIIRDPDGREFMTKLKSWKDGRIWFVGGWHNVCRWNLVEKHDRCICEFVRGRGKEDLYLQIQVVHEVASKKDDNK